MARSEKPLKKLLAKRLDNPHVPGGSLHGDLIGRYKIKLNKQGVRLVYRVEDDALIVMVMAVDRREESLVYRSALARLVETVKTLTNAAKTALAREAPGAARKPALQSREEVVAKYCRPGGLILPSTPGFILSSAETGAVAVRSASGQESSRAAVGRERWCAALTQVPALSLFEFLAHDAAHLTGRDRLFGAVASAPVPR